MPIRTVKPQFFRSRKLAAVSHRARLTLIGLWCEADGHGRGVADPYILKGAIYPIDHDVTPDDITDDLIALIAAQQIVVYEVEGDTYFAVTDWEYHQAANYRRGESSLPPLANGASCTPVRASCTHERANTRNNDETPAENTFARMSVQAARMSVLEGKGREGKPPTRDNNTEFNTWWTNYPRKVGKPQALKAWNNALKTTTTKQLHEGLTNAKNHWTTTNTKPEYIPHPATWLNRHGWQDEYTNNNTPHTIDGINTHGQPSW
jgi:hypothetical protein